MMVLPIFTVECGYLGFSDLYGFTTLKNPKSKEVSTNNGIITQNIFNAAVATSSETK